MPIPFRDLRGEDSSGLAGYLRFVSEDGGRGIRGSLFLVSARGEPVDFAFSRIDVPAPVLWRSGEARREAAASLAATLFQACPRSPALLLAMADEVDPDLFVLDLVVAVPLCRVATRGNDNNAEVSLSPAESAGSHIFWVGQPPDASSPARQLLDNLQQRGLLTEPFERSLAGIEEAFRE